jgi:hypothetical protein
MVLHLLDILYKKYTLYYSKSCKISFNNILIASLKPFLTNLLLLKYSFKVFWGKSFV